tara:strand:+ start:3364 stop:3573 length:210 start_codon:yes stop_codon:yes gene_type:complete
MEKHLEALSDAVQPVADSLLAVAATGQQFQDEFVALLETLATTTGLLAHLNERLYADIQRTHAEEGDVS